ncbi:diguanylate cyclase [Sphingomonas sp. Leaf407]|uniref:putative bifunctional diguanylate cyclase/phosphodiesterase n=1 Tax=unclassified Sphingomonas TaxID=196159 RepID=UPI0006F90EDC|nr:MULTISPECIES: EAL domain-containing protein [unclassified Sphingomonas]KQN39461.1 diguanylate cyclase [Sphingomonas sp. Leaf42]KQT28737.1 diguanylate cyclase [Sphingomonas sp. Leaf407]
MPRPSLPRVVALVRGSLSAKLAVFYGALFALAVVLILIGVKAGIGNTAEGMIRNEMVASAKVFDRVTAMRYAQLGDAGTVLAGDFGFRSAAATGDAPTIVSALDSLRSRLRLDQAFFVGADGAVVGYRGRMSPRDADDLFAALDGGRTRGVLRIGDARFNAAAAAVKAPVTIGWVVFGNALDGREMARLARLSSIDLAPHIVPAATLDPAQRGGAVVERDIDGKRMLVQASPIASFVDGEPQVLLLRYSITDALAAYRPLLWLLIGCGAVGVVIAGIGSVMLARRITRPIIALDDAARRVARGDYTQVAVTTRDELGTLAASFNRMVDDIGERERQITHMALHDHLTGLANRVLLRDHLTMVIARPHPERRQALFCLDLDQFKVVNDTLGHPTGDALLCEIAGRLSRFAPDGFVARLGGDEFAIVLDDAQRSLDRVAHELTRVVAEPCIVNGHRIVPGTSIGIAILGVDGEDAVTLAKNADLALYRAKHDGRGGYRFFEATMDAEARKRRQMELDLHDAIAEGQLSLMFQPLFNLSETRVCAFEALLRWNHPVRGQVSPVDFIPLAEDTGLIVPIGEWVIREACRAARRWPDDVRVAVNVSPVQFRNPGLAAVILQALSESGLAPQRLELEITESLFIDNPKSTLASLHSLRALGVRVALDDFGTGYSSLSYLRAFPFDKIKIDRSFILDLLDGDGATAIIKSITTLAEALGMETTAEGVENAGQLDILREQGCTHIQGYYFSRPVPESEIRRMLGMEDEGARRLAG